MVNNTLADSPENLFNKHQHLAEVTLYRVLQNPKSVALSKSIEHEDLLQYAYMGLWKACLNYDSSKSKFQTHAIHNIRWGVMNGINRETSMIKYNTNNPPPEKDKYFINSIESSVQDQDGEAISQHELIPSDEDTEKKALDKALISELMQKLPQRDRKVIHMRFKGKTYKKIAEEIGVTERYASTLLKRIQKDMRRKEDIK